MTSKKYRVGIIGATGAVGREMIKLLVERSFPFSELRLFASARSAGSILEEAGYSAVVEETTKDIFTDLDIALFSAGSDQSKEFGPIAAAAKCVVIDNSSAFRMDDSVPLIVPEINPEAADSHSGIIANPNCSTAVSLMGLYPLHKLFGLKRMFVSTYQAVSGSGAGGIRELDAQVKAIVEGEPVKTETYPHQIAFNVLPHVDSFLDTGYTKEEMKFENEGRKIMNHPALNVSATCVRVPVYRTHCMSINAEFEKPVDIDAAKEAIANFEGAELCDNPTNNEYPLPLDYAEKVKCGVGRIRKDCAFDNGLALWVAGDQLWKGAALNAVQIAELLANRDKVSF